MSRDQNEKTPSERFLELLARITPEELAEIDRRVNDPDRVRREVAWRDDPDPFGRDWDWLKPAPEQDRTGGAPTDPR